eukprot:g11137.t1
MALPDNLEAQTDEGQLIVSTSASQSPAPPDAGLLAVDTCLEAAAFSLKFDIAELWRFGPDTSKRRSSGVKAWSSSVGNSDSGSGAGGTKVPLKPYCEHVYTMPATLKTYTGRIIGMWRSDFDDSRAPQNHVLSPQLCEQARASECPLWFTSTATKKLHPSLPLNTAVVLPVHLHADSDDEDTRAEDTYYVAVFLSLTLHERNLLSLDFLENISKAATTLFLEQKEKKKVKVPPQVVQQEEKCALVETHLQDVPVIAHPGGKLVTNVSWSELEKVVFLVNGSRCAIYTAVYKDQPVVVKVVRKDVQDTALVRDELEFELAMLRRVRHENIVRLLGAGKDPELFLVIAKLDGGTLGQRCDHRARLRDRRGRFKSKRPFTQMELLRYARQLAAALRHLHEEAIPGRMVIHRDVKPDNIGFTGEGELKLLDLGLSKVVSKSEMDNAAYNMTGETGSARYMAPEVAESRPYNEKVDVYSFGIVLWEMSTLKKPFEGMGRNRFFSEVIRGSHRPPINKKWPKAWSDLMQSCWAEDPAKRPSFAIVDDLLQGMLQEGIDQNWEKTKADDKPYATCDHNEWKDKSTCKATLSILNASAAPRPGRQRRERARARTTRSARARGSPQKPERKRPADDQPFDHKYDHPPAFDETEAEGVECTQHPEKGLASSTHGPEAEAPSVMRFVLWALNVKTDTGV